jgi:hypothetical protein
VAKGSIEGDAAGFGPGKTIVGFAQGDTIVLDGFSASSDIYVKNTGLELAGGAGSETLDITGNFTTGSFQVTESGGDTTIAVCFAEGTRIAVPGGEVAVEVLGIGDPVCTLYGGVRKVKWIGRRFYEGRFIRGNKAILPVCIKAGAIDDGVPSRDLFVSPGHAISIDDTLVHAIRLVNGVSITQAEAVERVAYYHVELETHEILLAENCPAESFMGEDFRRQFQNAEAFGWLYPGEVAPELMCQPRAGERISVAGHSAPVAGAGGLQGNAAAWCVARLCRPGRVCALAGRRMRRRRRYLSVWTFSVMAAGLGGCWPISIARMWPRPVMAMAVRGLNLRFPPALRG